MHLIEEGEHRPILSFSVFYYQSHINKHQIQALLLVSVNTEIVCYLRRENLPLSLTFHGDHVLHYESQSE